MSDENPFKIIGDQPPVAGREVQLDEGGDLVGRIEALIQSSDLMVFMKGNPFQPMCGFSANTCGILNQIGKEYKTFDILSDPEIRQGLKEYSNWPTFPQVYFKGKLVGGNDIVMEMHQSGDLAELLNS
jgi:monothiol glutaredoxin